ncbi:MAG: DegT/DnrJ/EryC1/StrS family aminotransferase [Candidatus Bathyarchaeota archaeon]|jgi:dTDP-4-amino-4,6-dideoxygalactose transaminase
MIPINAPQIGEDEIKAVVKVLRSGNITHGLGSGPMVTEFENAFARFAKAKHAIAVNTGTSALHSAIVATGVSVGDEVILPSFSFVATAEVVVMAGGKPVFVDINSETYNISVEEIKKAITEKTVAIMPVDMYGLSADMKPIKEIAEKHNLVIIEDSCQAHGAFYNGKPPGAYAKAACWSFYASKNMTTGEGGMNTTNDEEFAEKLRTMRSHGEKEKYNSLILGHNYRMPEIQAALGRVQLRRLPEFLRRRRENSKRFSEKLRNVKGLKLPQEPENLRHSWYLYTVRIMNANSTKRNRLLEILKKEGIGAEAYYVNPIHSMKFYRRYGKHKLPQTEKASEQVISLPVHPGVTLEQADFISKSTSQAIEKLSI